MVDMYTKAALEASVSKLAAVLRAAYELDKHARQSGMRQDVTERERELLDALGQAVKECME